MFFIITSESSSGRGSRASSAHDSPATLRRAAATRTTSLRRNTGEYTNLEYITFSLF